MWTVQLFVCDGLGGVPLQIYLRSKWFNLEYSFSINVWISLSFFPQWGELYSYRLRTEGSDLGGVVSGWRPESLSSTWHCRNADVTTERGQPPVPDQIPQQPLWRQCDHDLRGGATVSICILIHMHHPCIELLYFCLTTLQGSYIQRKSGKIVISRSGKGFNINIIIIIIL